MPDIKETIGKNDDALTAGLRVGQEGFASKQPTVFAYTREDFVDMVNKMGVALAEVEKHPLRVGEIIGKAGGENVGKFIEKEIPSKAELLATQRLAPIAISVPTSREIHDELKKGVEARLNEGSFIQRTVGRVVGSGAPSDTEIQTLAETVAGSLKEAATGKDQTGKPIASLEQAEMRAALQDRVVTDLEKNKAKFPSFSSSDFNAIAERGAEEVILRNGLVPIQNVYPEVKYVGASLAQAATSVSTPDDVSRIKEAAKAVPIIAPAAGVASLVLGARNLIVGKDGKENEPVGKTLPENRIPQNQEMIDKLTGDKEVISGTSQKAAYGHKTLEQLTTREGRKELLSKLGIDANTPDDFRLVMYQDKAQTVIFKGKASENGVTLTDSMVIQDTGNVAEGLIKDGHFKGEFKPLPKPIELPAVGKEGKIDLSPEQQKKLSADVTLMALADHAMNGSTAVASSNASLPYNVDRLTTRTV